MDKTNRRPIKTRSKTWAQQAAKLIAHSGVSPNQVSLIGIVISAFGGLCLLLVSQTNPTGLGFRLSLITAAICIQLRLICNMLDGMVAIEFNQKSPLGDLYNEVPDRVEDSIFFICAGYALGTTTSITLGWFAALLAACTAYIRVLGVSFGFQPDYCGPQAKQQRMFLLTVTLLFSMLIPNALTFGLCVISLGTIVTIARRLKRISIQMKSR